MRSFVFHRSQVSLVCFGNQKLFYNNYLKYSDFNLKPHNNEYYFFFRSLNILARPPVDVSRYRDGKAHPVSFIEMSHILRRLPRINSTLNRDTLKNNYKIDMIQEALAEETLRKERRKRL